jgi:hypothetical protein
VEKVGKVDDAGLDLAIASVMAQVAPLGDGEDKERLVAVVADSFKHPAEVLSAKDRVGAVIDGLYRKCQETDKTAAQAILDSIEALSKDADKDADKDKDKDADKDKDKDKDTDKAKDAGTQDMAALVDAAVAKAVAGVSDSFRQELSGTVDASVMKALGVSADKKSAVSVVSTDYDSDPIDVSDIVRDVWGRM